MFSSNCVGTANETTYATGGLVIPANEGLTLNGDIVANSATITAIEISYLDRLSANVEDRLTTISNGLSGFVGSSHTWTAANVFQELTTFEGNISVNGTIIIPIQISYLDSEELKSIDSLIITDKKKYYDRIIATLFPRAITLQQNKRCKLPDDQKKMLQLSIDIRKPPKDRITDVLRKNGFKFIDKKENVCTMKNVCATNKECDWVNRHIMNKVPHQFKILYRNGTYWSMHSGLR